MGQLPGRDDTLVQGYDARDRDSQKAWVAATVERFGRIDAVVANAGILIPKSVIEAEDHEIDDLYEVNVKAPMRLVRAAWPWLTATGRGRVIVMVSLSGKRVASARSGLYATSKFAALGLTHAIRQAGWEQGVRATAICPGFVATDMAAAAPGRPGRTHATRGCRPHRRHGARSAQHGQRRRDPDQLGRWNPRFSLTRCVSRLLKQRGSLFRHRGREPK